MKDRQVLEQPRSLVLYSQCSKTTEYIPDGFGYKSMAENCNSTVSLPWLVHRSHGVMSQYKPLISSSQVQVCAENAETAPKLIHWHNILHTWIALYCTYVHMVNTISVVQKLLLVVKATSHLCLQHEQLVQILYLDNLWCFSVRTQLPQEITTAVCTDIQTQLGQHMVTSEQKRHSMKIPKGSSSKTNPNASSGTPI